LRQGELLGLRWADVDLDAGKLSVRRALKIADPGLDFGPPKNKASRRSVRLNKTATAALRAHRARQNQERIAARTWRDTGLVFPNRIGGPIDPTNLYNREYKPLLKRVGLEALRFTRYGTRSLRRFSRAASIRSACNRYSGTRRSRRRWTPIRTLSTT